ncbi:Isochorismatase hydrolase [Hypoxylon sp. NC1633]|nr:Isochorismatase hydrolase [Hypoxylon sp. NC1633]
MSFLKASRHAFARGRPITALPSPSIRQTSLRTLMATPTMADSPQRHFKNPAIFICDMQEKFRKAIWQFDKVVLTAQKVLRVAQILDIPIIATTQNASKLGGTIAELQPLIASARASTSEDKTGFSMLRAASVSAQFPPVLDVAGRRQVAIVGIEAHICVAQTALDLQARGHRVYVLVDGVSSCNAPEIDVALARLRAAGVHVTTSEAWLYECMGDAGIPEFREVAGLVKETGRDTRDVLAALVGRGGG